MPRARAITTLRVGLTALAIAGAVLGSTATAQAESIVSSALSDSYTALGSSHIDSINAELPITKTNLIETLDLKTLRIVKGTLPIAPRVITFTALGVVPVRSTTTLVQATPITGAIRATKKGNVLKTSVSYTIKLSDVEAQILGQWVPLDVGNDCQTIDPAVIRVSSPKGRYFDIVKGGVVTGKYTIGKFQNCAVANLPGGLGSIAVNSLVPGSGNTVRIVLSHGRYVAH